MEAFADRYLLVHMARAREESEVHDLVSRLIFYCLTKCEGDEDLYQIY